MFPPPAVMPDILLCSLTAIAKGSIANINRCGDRGQPCWVDLCSLEGFDVAFLIRISGVGFMYNNGIHLIKTSHNPYLGEHQKGNASLFYQRLGKHLLKAMQCLSHYVSHEVYSRPS